MCEDILYCRYIYPTTVQIRDSLANIYVVLPNIGSTIRKAYIIHCHYTEKLPQIDKKKKKKKGSEIGKSGPILTRHCSQTPKKKTRKVNKPIIYTHLFCAYIA